jgi:hypothetical protein
LAQSGLHAKTQLPKLQDGVPLFVLHALPHAPQLVGSVPMEVSQFVPG